MSESLQKLYEVVLHRKEHFEEGSYTCYLFEKGLDKILKKCGEECSEVIIAAKNKNNTDTANEICDLLYHVTVLMAEQGIAMTEVLSILDERSAKIGYLKKIKETDKNT